jgi:hypothetical protein
MNHELGTSYFSLDNHKVVVLQHEYTVEIYDGKKRRKTIIKSCRKLTALGASFTINFPLCFSISAVHALTAAVSTEMPWSYPRQKKREIVIFCRLETLQV